VEREVGRHDPRQPAVRLRERDRFQLLFLVLRVEPVPALDLDRGDPERRHTPEARRERPSQLGRARGAHRAHGRHDAPAGASDLLVGRAPHPPNVFVMPRSDERGMRVRIT
jgi:hypothetical protein